MDDVLFNELTDRFNTLFIRQNGAQKDIETLLKSVELLEAKLNHVVELFSKNIAPGKKVEPLSTKKMADSPELPDDCDAIVRKRNHQPPSIKDIKEQIKSNKNLKAAFLDCGFKRVTNKNISELLKTTIGEKTLRFVSLIKHK